MRNEPTIDFEAIRRELATRKGLAFWRSLEELANSESFQKWFEHEFPPGAQRLDSPISRRTFLKLSAASLVLAGLSACTGQAPEQIIPYVRQPPEQMTPGKPLYFATAHLLGGYAEGVLAESHMGRPIKIEGNPDHPASLGASDIFAQASVLSLYDPDRSQGVLRRMAGRATVISNWSRFFAALREQLRREAANGGAGVRLLTPTVTSPALVAQIEAVLQQMPEARWYQHEAVEMENLYEGTRLAFGEPLEARYNFLAANIIVSLDADFLMTFPGRLRYTRDFSTRRMVSDDDGQMNRLYAVYSTPTLTSSMADHYWALQPAQIEALARRLAQRLGVQVEGDLGSNVALPPALEESLDALVGDLQQNGGSSVVLAGIGQPPLVQALAHAMNVALGNVGETVTFSQPVQAGMTEQGGGLAELTAEIEEGTVSTLLILDGNPVYTAPADLDFAAALQQVPFSSHLSLYQDETSALCGWHLPQSHYLEAWGDARAFDGTVTIQQPLIEPLYDTRSPLQVLAALVADQEQDPFELLRSHWQAELEQEGGFEAQWRAALHDGVLPDSQLPEVEVDFQPLTNVTLQAQAEAGGLIVIFQPDPALWDGRFANNAWLQELPKPVTKLTWDNAAIISPALAERLGVSNEGMLQLQAAGRQLLAAAFVLPGQAENCVTLHLGYGREAAGHVGDGAGFNAYRLRTTNALWHLEGVSAAATGGSYPLATTQNHHLMEGRDLVRVRTTEPADDETTSIPLPVERPPSIYPEFEYDGYAWGMSINLNTCTGCNACVIACQAENNIPVVGKEEVRRGREMHWIRVDHYFGGNDLDAPRHFHQPVPCMHCEKAPCEPVCPVAATSHSAEGLNEMTYNRCVGTRYCSNNCPYKVRRFNFLDYAVDGEEEDIPVLNLLYNPDVTVRSRGVMEKCTYCVQRINRARSEADREGRTIEDGELMTACQQACPAKAIIFGDINNPDSAVSQLKAQPDNYGLLAQLGTQPRTTYLAKVLNLNGEIE
jgi:molybdopterin-containing oxidoreductase family iron-sulfur binding subunit